MKRLITIAFLTSVLALCSFARNSMNVVWDRPAADQNFHNHEGYFKGIFSPTRVEFAPERTIIDFEEIFRPNYWFQVSPESYITTGDKKYKLTGAEGIEIGKKNIVNETCVCNFRLFFEPLPAGTKKFDFIENEADDRNFYNIKGITDPAITARQLVPSTWRNEHTGDWEIGFFEEGVVYDSRLWNYVGDKRPGNSSCIEMSDGNETIRVFIGKLKNGKRMIGVGSNKPAECTMITSRTLPDYPIADMRKDFKDNRYATCDTAIVRGWLRDRPEKMRMYCARYTDLITNDFSAGSECDVDSLGRFTLKIPLKNSMECFFDWDNTFIRTILEPGESYFLLYDFGRGQKLFMGKDCRLQNELLSRPLPWSADIYMISKTKGLDAAIEISEKELEKQLADLDSICRANPLLSERFKEYVKGHLYYIYAGNIGQTRFSAPDHLLTDRAVKFLTNILSNHIYKPYSLHRDLFLFVNDFTDDNINRNPKITSIGSTEMLSLLDYVDLTPDEKMMTEKWKRISDEYEKNYALLKDSVEKSEYTKRFNEENASLLEFVNKLLTSLKMQSVLSSHIMLKCLKGGVAFLDSLGADSDLKSIWLTQQGMELLDNTHRPLATNIETYLRENITLPHLFDCVMAENDKFIALDRLVKGGSTANLKREIPNVESIKEGAVLVDSIISPHKGKIVLLDVWGTWCSPCRAALADSQKEYAELAGFDVVYVYLANNSPEDSWRNLIEEYNVKGENCYHYNFPEEQQDLIEKFLDVNQYPSYRLFDREGNLLNIPVDPRNLPALKNVLEKL